MTMTPSFDQEAFQLWSIGWVSAHLSEITAFQAGLAALAWRAAILFRLQGKSRRAAALRRLAILMRLSHQQRRARRTCWRAALTRRAEQDGLGVFQNLSIAGKHGFGLARAGADVSDALWMDVQNQEIARRFPDCRAVADVDPALIDLFALQTAQRIPLTPPSGGAGCQAACAISGLLQTTDYPAPAAVAAILAVYFNPRSAQAHRLLSAALAAVASDDSAAILHRDLGSALE